MKLIRKLKQRNTEFKKHPISKDNRKKALCRYIYFHSFSRLKKRQTYRWINGLKFYAYAGEAGIVGNIWYGLFEFEESIFVLHFLRKDDLFLDIGANVGHYSLLASGVKRANSIAIEPVPATFEKLKTHISLNKLQKSITPVRCGVGQQNATLYFSTDKSTMNRIVAKDYNNKVEVPITTIDTLCDSKEVCLMKIDVEGYEKFALDGAKNVLKNNGLKAVIIEINDSVKYYNINTDEIVSIFYKNGFKPYKYEPTTRKLILLDTYNSHQFNTIFIRDDDYVQKRVAGAEKVKIWNKLI